MKIVFMLKAGVIEWEVPQDQHAAFNFVAMATSVRMNGYFMANDIYVLHSALVGMTFAPDTATPTATIRKDMH